MAIDPPFLYVVKKQHIEGFDAPSGNCTIKLKLWFTSIYRAAKESAVLRGAQVSEVK